MNIFNILGIVFALIVLLVSMFWGNPNPARLLDGHALLIVLGGTFAAVGVAFQLDRAGRMFMVFVEGIFRFQRPDYRALIEELMMLSDAYRKNSPELESQIEKIKDPFLKESMTALMDGILKEEHLHRVLSSRVTTVFERYNEDAKMFVAMGKFPPAMGLLGAVLGMINLLGSVGQAGAESKVGPAMAVAMVATLYGIAFANLFVIPIGENLKERAKVLRLKNSIIVEGVKHIETKINPIVLAEELNSYLLPSERVDWKAVQQKV